MKKALTIFTLLLFGFSLSACQDVPTSEAPSNEDILNLILEEVSIPEYVTEDLDLPSEVTKDGYTAYAQWRSTASSIIDNEGKIHADVADQTATLVLTLTYEGETVTKNFTVTVVGDEDYLVLYVVLNNLISIPQEEISTDIELPTQYIFQEHVITANWLSSDESKLSSNGVVSLGNSPEEVELYLEITLNNATMSQTYTVNIAQDPETLPVNYFHLSPVYTGEIVDEATRPYTPNCYPGAIYRKVVSSKDYWIGIEATVTLPEFIPDPERVDSSALSYYLDNSSIYLGGNAYYESDVGMAWSIGYETKDSTTVSRTGVAFRPFWRYITKTEGCTNNNCFRNASARAYEYYYFPGDTIRMSVFSPKPGYLQLRIELISETTNPNYTSRRADYGLTEDFNKIFISDIFPSAGMGEMPAEFKRVNAIDQVKNEAKPTINTNAEVNDAIWHEVYLYRNIDNELYKVPMTENRTASMICPLGENINGDFTNAFEISYEGVDKTLGGEVVTLNPNNGTGRLYNLVLYIEKKEETLI